MEEVNPEALEELRQDWWIGSEAFRQQCLKAMDGKVGENHPGQTRLETTEARADRIVVEELARLHLTRNDLVARRQYDFLNRLTQISSAPSGSSTISSTYGYNLASQRNALTNADACRWVYTYDALGQVTSGKKYWPDGTPVAGQEFEYVFDDIGNRKTASAGGDQNGANLRVASYAANNLNQYLNRTVPGAVDVIGSANSNAVVTVGGQTLYRKGEYFRKEFVTNNASAAVWMALTNVAALAGNPDIATNSSGNVFVPQTPENFSYDLDGNLTADGRWQYTWDGENRLVTMQALPTLPTAAKLKLEFQYDAQGRRIQKTVSTNNGSAYYPQSTNRFAYDGWNLVAILNPQASIVQSFTWGTDLSGSRQGAGGIGGLLAIGDVANGTDFVAFDGNGNVVGLVRSLDGTTGALYEYGPFGEVLRATGAMARSNPFRFSSKFEDEETDMVYFGLRYFDVELGRWVSRDPIGDLGGLNIYAFVQNNLVSQWDYLGMGAHLSPFNGEVYNQTRSTTLLIDGDWVEDWYQLVAGGSAETLTLSRPWSYLGETYVDNVMRSSGYFRLLHLEPGTRGYKLLSGHDTRSDWDGNLTKIVDADFLTAKDSDMYWGAACTLKAPPGAPIHARKFFVHDCECRKNAVYITSD